MLSIYGGSVFSLYVHIPFCGSRCDYCDFFSSVPHDSMCRPSGGLQLNSWLEQQLLTSLRVQLQNLVQRFGVTGWRTIYIGGGTPSLLSATGIASILDMVASYAKIISGAEITVEVNPEDCIDDWLLDVVHAGVTRVSAGIQAMDDFVLRSVHRRTTVLANRRILSLLQKTALQYQHFRWSVDIIAGLPGQNRKSFFNGLTEILSYNPRHISLYTLSVEPETPLYTRLYDTGGFHGIDEVSRTADSLWFLGRQMIQKNGLVQYEVSNFAVSGNESCHNCVYWHQNSWLGIGPGGSGTIFFTDGTGLRIAAPQSISTWLDNPIIMEEEKLDRIVCMKEFIMTGFRMVQGISIDDFYSRFGISFFEEFGNVWNKWEKEKKAATAHGRAFLLQGGFLFLDQFLQECFLLV